MLYRLLPLKKYFFPTKDNWKMTEEANLQKSINQCWLIFKVLYKSVFQYISAEHIRIKSVVEYI